MKNKTKYSGKGNEKRIIRDNKRRIKALGEYQNGMRKGNENP